jgi:hypothetical protein
MPENALDGYRKIAEDSVVPLKNQYNWRADWHRRNFRLSGIVVILVSASLPLLAAFDYWWKDLVVAVAGVVIATVTGLRTFYHWDQMWGVLRRTHFDLTHATTTGWSRSSTRKRLALRPKSRAAPTRRSRRYLRESTRSGRRSRTSSSSR